MSLAHRRHDISDHAWHLLEPHRPGRKGSWGGSAKENRPLIHAVFWIMRTGAPWRDLPPDDGPWSHTHRRFIRWRDKGYQAVSKRHERKRDEEKTGEKPEFTERK